jgi:hypothetical protein
MRRKKMTTKDKIDYLLQKLTEQYSPEKTEEDYRQDLQSLTRNSDLIDMTLRAWAEALIKI